MHHAKLHLYLVIEEDAITILKWLLVPKKLNLLYTKLNSVIPVTASNSEHLRGAPQECHLGEVVDPPNVLPRRESFSGHIPHLSRPESSSEYAADKRVCLIEAS
ncbi:hypothetical protein SAY86_007097 [Trapa natans]|uniref:Uncharacterized protein n=1 Tax=Trapa natans TaxID=22666 RepID=A0AAN7LGR7_TRANT|nr:hypothetical protein SAY86_007097 [Trapa natans]